MARNPWEEVTLELKVHAQTEPPYEQLKREHSREKPSAKDLQRELTQVDKEEGQCGWSLVTGQSQR